MNEQTEKNINEAIDWLQQTGGSIQDFAVEQAPLYCREVVAWELWYGIAGIVLGLAVLLGGVWLVRKAMSMYRDDGDGTEAVPGMTGALAIIGGVVIVAGSAPSAIKAAVAPRLVIVEHLRGMK